MNKSKWVNKGGYLEIIGKYCFITLERRPGYCDRGNWIAKVFPKGQLAMDMDSADGWPRYYFDEQRAKDEVIDWLKKRKQYD